MNQINTSLLLEIALCDWIQILLCCLWLFFLTRPFLNCIYEHKTVFNNPLQMGQEFY